MTEIVVEFGPAGRLVGVLSRPDAGRAPAAADVAVIITNAGIIHRVGPNRLHVRLARFLASHGYPCLRYDLPGIGDSETVGGGPIAQEKLSATRAALDRLESMGVARRFVMIGLCSGADHSFMTSVVDPRVVGAVVIDPTTVFSTRRHRLNRILRWVRRGLKPRVLWRLLTGHYGILSRGLESGEEHAQRGHPHAPDPEDVEVRAQVVAALQSLVSREVQIYMVMTRHSGDVYRKSVV